VVLPRAFLLHAGHGCGRAPGLPCALFIREGHASDINSGVIRREIAKACLDCLKFKSWK